MGLQRRANDSLQPFHLLLRYHPIVTVNSVHPLTTIRKKKSPSTSSRVSSREMNAKITFLVRCLEVGRECHPLGHWKSAKSAPGIDLDCLDDVLRCRGLAESTFTRRCHSRAASERHLPVHMVTDTRVIDIPTTSAISWVLGTVDQPTADIKSHLIGCNLRSHVDRRDLDRNTAGKLEM